MHESELPVPVKDAQSVTPEGVPVAPRIAGVAVRMATTHVDERGEICEIYSPAWGLGPVPLVYVYQSLVRPGKVKGWVVHRLQDDRLFVSLGFIKIVLYDARSESPTLGMVNEILLSERNRGLVIVPQGVYHAVQNIGESDALFLNMPSLPYDHANPDKYRLPLDTDAIPYRFESRLGY
ncbi:MAG TPA: dTDP-4-dehydrorhamnose 3,5-epimerase family protein [Thermoanaerobaculia bacterium]|nr:dTDP-4-dehydrorhamnose 3,5-epimerase family protein [Thermoanaerobaculia bacterium]